MSLGQFFDYIFYLSAGILIINTLHLVKNGNNRFKKATWNPFSLGLMIAVIIFLLPFSLYSIYPVAVKMKVGYYYPNILETFHLCVVLALVSYLFLLAFLFFTIESRAEKKGFNFRMDVHEIGREERKNIIHLEERNWADQAMQSTAKRK